MGSESEQIIIAFNGQKKGMRGRNCLLLFTPKRFIKIQTRGLGMNLLTSGSVQVLYDAARIRKLHGSSLEEVQQKYSDKEQEELPYDQIATLEFKKGILSKQFTITTKNGETNTYFLTAQGKLKYNEIIEKLTQYLGSKLVVV